MRRRKEKGEHVETLSLWYQRFQPHTASTADIMRGAKSQAMEGQRCLNNLCSYDSSMTLKQLGTGPVKWTWDYWQAIIGWFWQRKVLVMMTWCQHTFEVGIQCRYAVLLPFFFFAWPQIMFFETPPFGMDNTLKNGEKVLFVAVNYVGEVDRYIHTWRSKNLRKKTNQAIRTKIRSIQG